jgi:PII-like signaling protein
MGYGAAKRIRQENPLGRSSDVPVIIRIVDEKDKLDAFSDQLCDMIPQGIILREPVTMCLVRCGGKTVE